MSYNVNLGFDPDDSNHILWLPETVRRLTNRQLHMLGRIVDDERATRSTHRKVKSRPIKKQADPSVENLKKLFRF